MVLFEQPNFGGQSLTLAIGHHPLTGAADLEKMVSSVLVPAGLVAMLHDEADASGGWGKYVDLLEDHAELASLGFDDQTAYVDVFTATTLTTVRDHGAIPPTTPVETSLVWARNAMVGGAFAPGHWERPRAGGATPTGPAVVSPDPEPANALHLAKLDGSSWENPPYDMSASDWSSAIVGGKTFDGSDAHPFEWVSVLNPTVQQDDEVGLTGIALNPTSSGGDLPLTHWFSDATGKATDFEFGIRPDPGYENLLAPSNRTPDGPYADEWNAAHTLGFAVPAGVLGLEMDGALVPDDYRFENGDRIAIFGRWIVDAGHDDFHTEIHPPLVMARARFVDDNDQRVAPSAEAVTALQLWTRPYQVNQLFSSGDDHNVSLQTYARDILETARDVEAFPQVFPTPFDGAPIVSMILDPPPQPASPVAAAHARELRCSYHFVSNGSCTVQVQQAPTGGGVVVTLRFNSVNYPHLPELPTTSKDWSINDLLAQASGGVHLSWAEQGWVDLQSNVRIYTYEAPAMPDHTGENVVPFTALGALPTATVVDDPSQPFPIFGWLKLKWFDAGLEAAP